MPKPTVSVLIPVYNAGPYIQACLSSIIGQTFTALEIICVDDGSADDSLQQLHKIANQEPRLRVITQTNLGVAATRNRLLQEARGTYVAFIDADDVIAPDYLEKLYAAIEKAQADISKCFFKEFDRDPQILSKAHCTRLFYVQPGPSLAQRFVAGYYDAVVWGKLFRLETLRHNKLSFLPGQVAEDFPFVILSFMVAKRIAYVREVLYLYRKGNNNAITAHGEEMAVGILHNLLNLHSQLQQRHFFTPGVAHAWIKSVVWGVCRFRKLSQQIRRQQECLQKKAWQQARQSVALCGFWQGLRWRILFWLVNKCGWKSVYGLSKIFR